MEPVAAVLPGLEEARAAIDTLKRAGFDPENLNLLTPGSSEQQIHSVPVSESEQPGMGAAIGGVVGGALGAAGGFELGALGAAAASAVIPGVGPVVAIGIAAAALLGVGGAIGGAALGSEAEERTTPGPTSDEMLFYENALRQGRSVVIAMANGKGEAERARQLLSECCVESFGPGTTAGRR